MESSALHSTLTPVQDSMRKKIADSLMPFHLEIIDESGGHAGHAAMKNHATSSETHFKVIVVSDIFEGKSVIDRHRMVNDLLKEEFDAGLHALSIVAKTPSQWQK
mmetsp:Transcript_39641/g.29282  ORF Transcript_39641/g.29282 Transcript_39641/m.29282 type:complete len:105 (+) Transcript_39641:51-365(+)